MLHRNFIIPNNETGWAEILRKKMKSIIHIQIQFISICFACLFSHFIRFSCGNEECLLKFAQIDCLEQKNKSKLEKKTCFSICWYCLINEHQLLVGIQTKNNPALKNCKGLLLCGHVASGTLGTMKIDPGSPVSVTETWVWGSFRWQITAQWFQILKDRI